MNAGRKPVGDRALQRHAKRPVFERRTPVHVTVRVRNDVATLRNRSLLRLFHDAFAAALDRFGMRVVEFSIQGNHIHLVVEADDSRALSRGMQGLLIRLAAALNARLRRAGSVFRDRYHPVLLKTPRQVRNALAYVLNNARKHARQRGLRLPADWVDPLSSGPWFTGWTSRIRGPDPGPRPTGTPRTWLLARGWTRHGLIPLASAPGA